MIFLNLKLRKTLSKLIIIFFFSTLNLYNFHVFAQNSEHLSSPSEDNFNATEKVKKDVSRNIVKSYLTTPLRLESRQIVYDGSHALLMTKVYYYSAKSGIINAIKKKILPFAYYGTNKVASLIYAKSYKDISLAENLLHEPISFEELSRKNIFGPDGINALHFLDINEQVTFTLNGSLKKGLNLSSKTASMGVGTNELIEFRFVILKTGINSAIVWVTNNFENSNESFAGLGLFSQNIDAQSLENSKFNFMEWANIFTFKKLQKDVQSQTIKFEMNLDDEAKRFYDEIIVKINPNKNKEDISSDSFIITNEEVKNVIETIEAQEDLRLLQKDEVAGKEQSHTLNHGWHLKQMNKELLSQKRITIIPRSNDNESWEQERTYVVDRFAFFQRRKGIKAATTEHESSSLIYRETTEDPENKNLDFQLYAVDFKRKIFGINVYNALSLQRHLEDILPKSSIDNLFDPNIWTISNINEIKNIEIGFKLFLSPEFLLYVQKQSDKFSNSKKFRSLTNKSESIEEIRAEEEFLKFKLQSYYEQIQTNVEKNILQKGLESTIHFLSGNLNVDTNFSNLETSIDLIAKKLSVFLNPESNAEERAQTVKDLSSIKIFKIFGTGFLLSLIPDHKFSKMATAEITLKYTKNEKDSNSNAISRKVTFGKILSHTQQKLLRSIERSTSIQELSTINPDLKRDFSNANKTVTTKFGICSKLFF